VFAEVLRTFRRQRGLSQEALADATDLSRPYISQLERSLKSPSLRIVARLAEALHVSLSEMMVMVERETDASPTSRSAVEVAATEAEPPGTAGQAGRS